MRTYSLVFPYHLTSASRPGGGGTPLYKVYKYVPPQRVWFLSRFGLKTGIDFDNRVGFLGPGTLLGLIMYNNESMYFHSFRIRFFILLFCSVILFPLDRLVYVQTVFVTAQFKT